MLEEGKVCRYIFSQILAVYVLAEIRAGPKIGRTLRKSNLTFAERVRLRFSYNCHLVKT